MLEFDQQHAQVFALRFEQEVVPSREAAKGFCVEAWHETPAPFGWDHDESH
jgi:hypothetical protein